MAIEIKGFIETSLIDWDGKITSVIFLPGCNFKCPNCHAHEFILHPEKLETVPFEIIKNRLLTYKNWLDGIVISGGEPSIHSNLPDLIKELKSLKILIKLDTNGTNPILLKKLVQEKLIDYVAMDIKAPLDKKKYEEAVGNLKVNLENIKTSIAFLLEKKVDYEFRTTVIPTFHKLEDIIQIAQYIKRAVKYALQQFIPKNALKQSFRKLKTYSLEELEIMAEECKKYISNIIIRKGSTL